MLIAVLTAPIVLLEIGRERSVRCLAEIEAPRANELPGCEIHGRWFDLPRRAPWTHHFATLYQEELAARMVMARYVDAAVGTPDRAAQRERFAALTKARRLVEEGTGRQRLSQLGRTTGAPEPGRLAYATGDRAALIDRGLEWTQWYISNRAMEAALLHGDLPRAIRLAEHYAGRPDSDLRLHVAALLCIGGHAERGLEHAQSVEQSRAGKRNANIARNYGAARVLVEECARRAGLAPPAPPGYAGAGEWDHRERHAVQRLRTARRQPGCDEPAKLDRCADPDRLTAAVEAAMNLLGAGIALDFRLELAAAALPYVSDGRAALPLITPREGEPTPETRVGLTIRRLVERDQIGQPALHPDQLTLAAEHLLSLTPHHPELQRLAGAMLARAAAGYAGLERLEPAMD